jgi:anti-anti-sigma regulatory factor/type II secretory pathway pseudopilin PulG
MLQRLAIRTRLLVALGIVAIIAAGATSVLGYRAARAALEAQAFERLTAVREMKAAQVEGYFEQITDQIVVLAQSRTVIDGLRQLTTARAELARLPADPEVETGLRLYYQREVVPRVTALAEFPPVTSILPDDPVGRRLQRLYLANNPFDLGEKHLLDDAGDGSRFSQLHATLHPFMRTFLQRFGYYDIFLIDRRGHIVYSVFKEIDFATSLTSGPHRESNLARAFRAAVEAEFAGFTRLVDFDPYLPSYGAEASFVATPVFDGDEAVGVLAFQMPVDRINAIMTSRQLWDQVGLGSSGETYIVGSDSTLRSQSRFLIEDREEYLRRVEDAGTSRAVVETIDRLDSAIGLQEVRTPGTEAARAGETGTRRFPDYRDVPVLSAFRPLQIADVDWVIMSEIDVAEAFQPAVALRNRLAMVFVVVTMGGVIVALMLARAFSVGIERLTAAAGRLAKGDLDTEIRAVGDDEIADLAEVLDGMRIAIRQHSWDQEQAIEALSTPLIPFHNEILIAPLIGVMDAARVARLRDSVVDSVTVQSARVVIIDLTGVPELRDDAPTELARTAKAARLLGTHVILTGVRGEVALALTELTAVMDGIDVQRSLHHGIDRAMSYLERSARRTTHHGDTRQ